MAKRLLRKTLSAPGLLRAVRKSFDKVLDPVPSRKFTLSDCLMSGLAVFGLKYPSLLQFDRDARTDEVVRANLKTLYGIERAPCDTALRERLDEVDPRELRGVFKRVFAQLQRGKGLEVELTRFRGYRTLLGGGIHDATNTPTVSACLTRAPASAPRP